MRLARGWHCCISTSTLHSPCHGSTAPTCPSYGGIVAGKYHGDLATSGANEIKTECRVAFGLEQLWLSAPTLSNERPTSPRFRAPHGTLLSSRPLWHLVFVPQHDVDFVLAPSWQRPWVALALWWRCTECAMPGVYGEQGDGVGHVDLLHQVVEFL